MFFDFSMSKMKEAMFSSSVLRELAAEASASSWSDFDLSELLLPGPELVLLLPVLVAWEE